MPQNRYDQDCHCMNGPWRCGPQIGPVLRRLCRSSRTAAKLPRALMADDIRRSASARRRMRGAIKPVGANRIRASGEEFPPLSPGDRSGLQVLPPSTPDLTRTIRNWNRNVRMVNKLANIMINNHRGRAVRLAMPCRGWGPISGESGLAAQRKDGSSRA